MNQPAQPPRWHRIGHSNHEQITREPIAIVGIGCRFPGKANTPEEYWRLIRDKIDAVTDIPADRWDLKTFYDPRPSIPGKTNIRHGGFVENIDLFDPDFFGISPREASRMDPQQRLLLEVAWEAFEDGGQVLERLQGTATGVFVGVSSWDYTMIQAGYRDRKAVDVYTNTGGALSIAANRISYSFDLTGPSMAIDTACSSGLTAVHLACNAIWNGECHAALAGAVSMLITPGPYLGFSMLSMLSPDGRCKAFDARANGFVRSEGAGMIMLKPLSQALADGDMIYALVRGTAINQDGSTTGLTVPSQDAQNRLIKKACSNAGIEPRQVQFVEAHGTGTLVGDPIEARALGEALRNGRSPDQPCRVGSVKTNVGHLESAAGIAGLIKVALALKNRTIPANLHFQQPNPDIDFKNLGLTVPTESEYWPTEQGTRLAGINSFGFGGSNAHIVLEGFDTEIDLNGSEPKSTSVSVNPGSNGSAVSRSTGNTNGAVSAASLIPLSARSLPALKSLASIYAQRLESSPLPWPDILHTTRFRRTHHEYRAALVADSRQQFIERLRGFAEGERQELVAQDRNLPGRNHKLVFVCCGQGPQWWAMGRQLMHDSPVFKQMIERCDQLIRQNGADWSLIDQLNGDEADSRISDTAIAQPAIFAIQVGLASQWQSWGIRPAAIIGHSVGEIAAAYLAGALTLEDAVRVIYHRGRCMALASKDGGMLAVGLSESEAAQRCEKFANAIQVAACNAPRSVTVSGDMSALEQLAEELERDRVFCKFLRVNQSFHSQHMDPAHQHILDALSSVTAKTTELPLVSTVTGNYVDGTTLSADYWWKNIRQSVRFAAGIDCLLNDEYTFFLELSPHPVLVSSISECAHEADKSVKVFGSLRRQEPELPTLLRSLGALYCAGYPVQWDLQHSPEGHLVKLPTYPWQREVYWHEAEESRENRLGLQGNHPLLGRDMKVSAPMWQSTISLNHLPYMVDHQVQGHVLVPGTGMLEIGLAVGKQAFGAGPFFLENVKFLKAIFLNPGIERLVQTTFNPMDSSFQIRTGSADPNSTWSHNCSGKVYSRIDESAEANEPIEQIQSRCTEHLSQQECYQLFEKLDIKYGPGFQGIRQLWRGSGEALGEIHVPEAIAAQIDQYQFHPAILDACLQCVFGTIPVQRMNVDSGRGVFLPVEIQEVRVYRPAVAHLWVHAQLESMNRQGITVQLQVFDRDGNLVTDIRGLVCQYVGMHGDSSSSLEDLLYQFKWRLSSAQQSTHAAGMNSGESLTELASSLAIGTTSSGRKLSTELIPSQTQSAQTGLVHQLNQLSAIYLVEAFQQLGCEFVPGKTFTVPDLIQQLGIAEQHQRIMPRFLTMLAEEGILARTNSESCWQIVGSPAFDCAATIWRTLLQEYPAFYAELTMIRRCASRLNEVLRGDLNPLQLIFPDGSLDTAEHLYQDSPSVRVYNTLTQQAISRIVSKLPTDRMIRILEIGAGTGGLTSYLLPHLPPDRTQYVFTDLSNHFFNKGKQKFADYPFIEYRLLDIEKDPEPQGFGQNSFDLVIASQVLHATENLTNTLTHVRRVLADDGLLVMLELLKPARWVDLVFGLTEGWWRFSDLETRPDYPLLPFEKWRDLLNRLGFGETVNIAHAHQVDGFGSAVIFSRAVKQSVPLQPMVETVQNCVEPISSAMDTTCETGVSSESEDASQVAEDAAIDSSHRVAVTGKLELDVSWLIFVDRQGIGEQIAERIRQVGGQCHLVRPGTKFSDTGQQSYELCPTSLEDFEQLLSKFANESQPPNLLHLWNLDAPATDSLNTENLIEAHDLGCMSLVHLYQAWSRTIRSESRSWIVTRHAQNVVADEDTASTTTSDLIQLAQTNVWGLSRVLFNEYSKLKGRMIDLGQANSQEIDGLLAELALDCQEDEVALRGEARYVNRYIRGSLTSTLADPSESRYRLESLRNELDGLAFRACQRTMPSTNQVVIEVRAAALNFSDVMKSLGLYPGLPDGPVPLGIECAGRVVAVGPEVQHLKIGDDVMALAPFAFGSHVTTYAPLCAMMPKQMSYAEASTVPIAFLTAHYALVHLARLQPGERVLIHSAAGGVGLAAIQIAQQIGAQVYATAGSTEKREFLRSIGIEHVLDSRTLKFADQIMQMTGGEGVDVVLNSLSGEAINKSLSVLGEYGRFLEIGKRDIYMNSSLGMRPFKKNVSFIAIDLDRVMRLKPQLMAELFQDVSRKIADKSYRPLPHRVFSATGIKSAFRYMAQAKHLGKVVVSFEDAVIRPLAIPPEPIKFRADATYFISGGLGGFGLLVARWMAEQGARNFILMGRRGIHSEQARAGVETLEQMGARVCVVSGNIAKPEDLRRAFEQAQSLPPLAGVLHAAMHLEDCLLNHLDRPTMLRVVEPKMLGAWNLYTFTKELPLDFFVCFSSMGSVFGMPGQANYASGNLFLDSLPTYLRQIGKSGTTINWGYLREVGYVAERAELVERFESQGFSGISPREALALLGQLLTQPAQQVSIVRMDWSRARDLGLASLIAPRFQELADQSSSSASQEGTLVRKALLAVVPEKRKPILLAALKERIAAVLGASPDKIDVDTPLTDVGVDSLMAVELRNWVESELRVSLPIVELMEGPTVNRLADLLLEQFSKSDPGSSSSSRTPSEDRDKDTSVHSSGSSEISSTSSVLVDDSRCASDEANAASMVEQMSDSEVDAMLSALADSSQSRDQKHD